MRSPCGCAAYPDCEHGIREREKQRAYETLRLREEHETYQQSLAMPRRERRRLAALERKRRK